MKKKSKVSYTNEELSKKFKSNFDLVNYAIRLTENKILSGRDSTIKSDYTQNLAMLMLEEIRQGEDKFYEIKEPAINPGKPGQGLNGEVIVEEKFEKKRAH
ncbi:MAG: hypothetical protein Q8K60_09060 [Parachlamydiaceae bacterium]|nr:hypothetical protein [Parachlamydiaceae bacterium]